MSLAYKKIGKEMFKLNREEPEGISIGPIDDSNILLWEASITGPENTPYEGGNFNLKIEFPRDSYKLQYLLF